MLLDPRIGKFMNIFLYFFTKQNHTCMSFENVFEEGKFFGQQFESFFQSFIFLSQFFNSEGSLLSLVLCLELKNKIIKNKIQIIW